MPHLHRREILSGLGLSAAAPLLGAFCRNMTPEALGQVVTRKRILFYLTGLGWAADTTGKPSDTVLYGNEDGSINLGAGWAPLEPYRQEMIFLRDIYHPFNAGGHANHYLLSSTQLPGVAPTRITGNDTPGPPAGISLDRLISKEIKGTDLHQSISMAATGGTSGAQSSDGPNQPFPTTHNPVTAYASLFAGGLPMTAGDPAANRLA